jgi:hypothetical protein
MTPPTPFLFEIVSKGSGTNVFTAGIYQPDAVSVIDLDKNTAVDFTFVDEGEVNLVVIHSIGWQTEKVNLGFRLAGEPLFSLFADAALVSEDCCSFTRFNEIRIENVVYAYDSETGIYKIIKE